MSQIHPMAAIDPGARIGADVRIGPFCHVGADVSIDDGCILHPHVTILGPAQIGRRNAIFPQCTIGAAPQDLKFRGGPTRVEIGDDNILRENVTIHRGTEVDEHSGGTTRIGNRNLLMVGVHVAHDVRIADHAILANYVQLAGHVQIEDYVNVGGHSAMHHFVTVGRFAYVGGMTRITQDTPPYMKVQGYDGAVRAVNVEGMRRWKIAPESIELMKEAFRILFGRRAERGAGRTAEALGEVESNGLMRDEHVRYLVDFVRRKMDTGVHGRAREQGRGDSDADREHFYRRADASARAGDAE
ncbi:MAG: acyl-ACP--UDP-N-acetylglucosamine O-acyltransferase [Phycisphaerae bacterium]